MGSIIVISGDQLDEIRRHTQESLEKVTGGQVDDFSLEMIRENDDSTPISMIIEVINAIQTPPFFGQKTVCLQNFSGFEKEGPKTDKGNFSVQCRRLAELIGEGLDPNINLILSGPKLDKRKSLAKAADKAGQVIFCESVKVSDRRWRDQVRPMIQQRAREMQLNMPAVCFQYLTEVIGPDTGRIDQELLKLQAWSSSGKPLSLPIVQDLCIGDETSMIWDLSNALAERKLKESLQAIDKFLSASKNVAGDCLALVRSLSRQFSELIQIRAFMMENRMKNPGQLEGFLNSLGKEQKAELKKQYAFVTMHPFRVKMLAQNASRYKGPELLKAFSKVMEVNRQLMSTATPPRMLLEHLVISVVR